MKALVDNHLVAAGTPVVLAARSLGTVFFLSGGVIQARHTLDAGTRYRVWSYVPDPSPSALARVRARYPSAAHRFLTVWGQRLPAFGETQRADKVRALLADPRYTAFGAYRPVFEEALRVTGNARTPYASVLALESWFRRSGGFRYDQQPPRSFEVPPLVSFVTATKAGYCQHFAGAMAVMLRLLGIPSRVAVGFTSGKLVERSVAGHGPQRARVGGGLVPGTRLGRLRPDSRGGGPSRGSIPSHPRMPRPWRHSGVGSSGLPAGSDGVAGRPET